MLLTSQQALLINSSKAPITSAYTSASSVGGSSPFTTGTYSIGTAFSTRYIVAAIQAASTSGASADAVNGAVTIGGVTATRLAMVNTSNQYHQYLFYGAYVPSGTTAAVVVNAIARASVSAVCYIITGLDGSTAPTIVSASDNTASASTLSASVTCPAGGIVFGVASRQAGSGSWTWSAITEDADLANYANAPANSVPTAAHADSTAGGTYNVVATPSAASATQAVLVIAMSA